MSSSAGLGGSMCSPPTVFTKSSARCPPASGTVDTTLPDVSTVTDYTRHILGRLNVSDQTTNGGHKPVFGIVVDIPAISSRYVRSALPHAPVQQDARWRHDRGGLARRRALRSRHG